MKFVPFEPPPGTKTHPILDIPMMTEDEFASLVWNIKRFGLLVPIAVTKDRVILDGRCRLMACQSADVEPRFRTFDVKGEAAAIGLICSMNFLRVNRNQSQQALAIAERRAEFPDYPLTPMPEACLVLRHEHLAQAVRMGKMFLADAVALANEIENQAALAAEREERLEHLRKEAPYFALQVTEGKLTIDQAIATAEEQAAAPVRADHVEAIRAIGRRMIVDVIEIGRRLTECKALLGHGNWLPWLEREFGWGGESTALNFMRVYRAFGPNPELVTDLDLPMNTFYLLARPSTPDAIREEILERAQHERISHVEVKRLVDGSRGKTSANRLQDDLHDLSERMAQARPDDPLVEELRQLLAEDRR